ncbi:MAG: hypothetical protein V2A69_13055 [Pseudomonadota bacterium]
MIDWVIKNKEWLFSGIGIVALGLLIAFGKTIYQKIDLKLLPTILVALGFSLIVLGIYLQFRSHPKVVEEPKEQTTPQITSINPYEIREKINSLPPYQQDEVRKNYRGLWVEWKGRFSHIESQKGGSTKVSLQAVPREPTKGIVRPVWLECTVQLSDYPQFKIMEKDTEVTVVGRIAGFDLVSTIVLDDVKLSFQETERKPDA